MRSQHVLVVTFIVSLFAYSCATTEQTSSATEMDTADSEYPVWYAPSGITSDSLNVASHAVSIGLDSADVISRARSHSLQKLEIYIGDLAEEMRFELERDDHPQARSIPAILQLRNANTGWEEMVRVKYTEVSVSKDSQKGFVAVELSKENILEKWKQSLTEHPAFLDALMSTNTYRNAFPM